MEKLQVIYQQLCLSYVLQYTVYVATILLEVCASMVSNYVHMCIGSLVPRPQITPFLTRNYTSLFATLAASILW